MHVKGILDLKALVPEGKSKLPELFLGNKCVTTVANNPHWYGSPTVSNRSLVNITLLMKSLSKTTAKIKFYNSHLAHIAQYQKVSQSLPFVDTIILTMYGKSVKVNWLLTALPQGSAIFIHCSWSHAKALLSQSFACTNFMADKWHHAQFHSIEASFV